MSVMRKNVSASLRENDIRLRMLLPRSLVILLTCYIFLLIDYKYYRSRFEQPKPTLSLTAINRGVESLFAFILFGWYFIP